MSRTTRKPAARNAASSIAFAQHRGEASSALLVTTTLPAVQPQVRWVIELEPMKNH